MKALVLKDFHEMVVAERPDPVAGRGEVLVRTVATGICGSDLHGFTGANGRRVPGQVMGHETAGRIAALGPDVTGLTVGGLATVNPVVSCGHCPSCTAGAEHHCPEKYVIGVAPAVSAAFAEYVVAPAGNVVALPDTMPAEYGALVEPIAVGAHAARRGAVTADDTVLVSGGGPIGQAVVLAARRLGVTRIVVSEPDPGRRALCATLGAEVVDPAGAPVPEQVRELLGGPASVAVDAVGLSATLADALAATSLGARIVLVGMAAPRVELAAFAVSTEERTLVGSFSYSAADFRSAAEWVAGTPPELAHLVERQVDLADAPAAFTALAEAPTPGKVLVRF
ncbi:zinc-dependent alcohol dehydrogenase [Actinocatenispora rupis]|uniref:Galactitol-1-phosphate 5-dehydrogenase n=1 Tax=Actinocatenispora rupis TaxID=519421 RepID=A0A8J3JCH2_9ACTN|nr:alcohol dehydrogenase catalytic domain-containing protein [Actinocatenispora rupis]GID15917.1 galactitol-1-phosphate 5-dehydrogenase [Actinocatenispora rupis]